MSREAKVCGLVPAVRPKLLTILLASWAKYAPNIELKVRAQVRPGTSVRADWERLREWFEPLIKLDWTTVEQAGPVFPQRVHSMLERPDVDVWVQVDDDIELLSETRFEPAILKAQEPGVGVVSCGWVRSLSAKGLARARRGEPWVRQPIVYMAGGMVYGRQVVAELAKVQDTPYLYDDVQVALLAYLAGRENWKYRGSIAIHRILQPGGIKRVFDTHRHVLPDDRFFKMPAGLANSSAKIEEHNIRMISHNDLKPEARRVHKENRRARGWS